MKYSYWHALIYAFFSPAFYCDVGQRWRGTGFLYLFFILALCWLPLNWHFYQQLKGFFQYQRLAVIQQLPDVDIRQGVVTIDKPVPHTVINPETNQPIAVFAIKQNYQDIPQFVAPLTVTKNALIMKVEGQMNIYPFTTRTNLHFTREAYQRAGEPQVLIFLAVLSYGLSLVLSFLYRVVVALFFAMLVKLMSNYRRISLPFSTIVRLVCVAMTPVLIINTIISYAAVKVPYLRTLEIMLLLSYLWFALKANQRLNNRLLK